MECFRITEAKMISVFLVKPPLGDGAISAVVAAALGPGPPIRKVDVEREKERFDWWAGAAQEWQFISKYRPLLEIGLTSALGLTRLLAAAWQEPAAQRLAFFT
jgi:hypothetical protein